MRPPKAGAAKINPNPADGSLRAKGTLKYLVVIALVALLLFLIYRKLRPYIKRLRQIIDVIRQFQQGGTPPERQAGPEKLVRCATCGIWIPASRALPSRAELVFCSTQCREGRK